MIMAPNQPQIPTIRVENCEASLDGISSMGLMPEDATFETGESVVVRMKLHAEEQMEFKLRGRITREFTKKTTVVGVNFLLETFEKNDLAAAIAKYGHYTDCYVRKYPRVPSQPWISTFPLNSLIVPDYACSQLSQIYPIDAQILNLNSSGALLGTENPLIAAIKPGDSIVVVLQPRGEFTVQIEIEAAVRRIRHEINTSSKTLRFLLGIQFRKVDQENLARIKDLFRLLMLQL